ncbi:hypothetical protein [Desulfovibrio sp. TomC]|uniref:hypothetical protein n=1 Tax=Desulfovibrio sp. TomC TaxID=1562888 RepID=UPI000575150E|nr:hypothetical protein [Desulfovibrio sp. TomC]KHK01860.1 hypothetical protein NY78_2679 [Desulfovibrio sp. TomC]
MAIDKPLPDSDDDIIDLTDFVEEGTDSKSAAGDNDVDMSFEQELDDLFGDAEPMPAKAVPAAQNATADADDELFDLAGFEIADDDAKATPTAATADADADDDIMDLAGLGLDAPDSPDILAFDEDKPAAPAKAAVPASADDDALDISDMSFDDLGKGDAPKAKDTADSFDDLDFGDLEEQSSADAPAEEALDGAAADSPKLQTPEAIAAVLTDDDDAVSDADLDALLAEPYADDAAMPDLLGALPDSPEVDLPGMADMPDMADMANGTDDAVAPAAAMAAAAVPLAAMAAAASARADNGPSVGGIDLGALDTLIDSSKAPQAQPEVQPAPDAALAQRLAALETAAADLGQRLDALPEVPNEDALAVALASRLEGALSLRLETLLASHSPALDLDGFKAGILEELHATLDDHLTALRDELPAAGDPARNDELTAALDSLREAVTRQEALSQGRHTQFEDFAQTMETRIAELRRELPDPDDFVTAKRLTEALDSLRESLGDDLAERLQTTGDSLQTLAGRIEALETDRIDPDALAEKLRTSLTDELTASLETRLDETAKDAREAVESLGDTLAGRIEALESDRIDPDALAEKLRASLLADAATPKDLEKAAETAAQAKADAQKALEGLDSRLTPGDLDAALKKLRSDLTTEMAAAMERTVPQAAAAVIREEIAALLQEFEG